MAALAPSELQRLISLPSGRGFAAARNRALIAVFGGAGVGVSEALALTVDDVESAERTIRVRGSRERTVALDIGALTPVVTWIAERDRLDLPRGAPLFCTREGQPLEGSYVRRLVARLGREAGIDAAVNARSLRETYAAGRMSAGASAEDLRSELGHSSVASTQRFVRHIGDVPGGFLESAPSGAVEALLEVAHCGLAVLLARRSDDGTIGDFLFEYVNPAAAGILGFSGDRLPGRAVRDVFPNAQTDGTYSRWIDLIENQVGPGDVHSQEAEGRGGRLRVRRVAVGDRILMSLEDRGAAGAAPNPHG